MIRIFPVPGVDLLRKWIAGDSSITREELEVDYNAAAERVTTLVDTFRQQPSGDEMVEFERLDSLERARWVRDALKMVLDSDAQKKNALHAARAAVGASDSPPQLDIVNS